MHFCILAAGEGSRMAHEGVEKPKPLIPLNGQPMIGRLMNQMIECGAESISLIVNNEMKEVAAFVQDFKAAAPVKINLLVKSTPSSMHSFYELSSIIEGEKFIITTVDTVFRTEDMRRYVDAFEADSNADALMAVTDYIDDEKPLYVEVDPDMNVTAFADTRSADTRFVSGGIYGLTPASIEVLKRCIAEGKSRMRNFQRELIASGLKVKAWAFGKILDVDHAEDIVKANNFITHAE